MPTRFKEYPSQGINNADSLLSFILFLALSTVMPCLMHFQMTAHDNQVLKCHFLAKNSKPLFLNAQLRARQLVQIAKTAQLVLHLNHIEL